LYYKYPSGKLACLGNSISSVCVNWLSFTRRRRRTSSVQVAQVHRPLTVIIILSLVPAHVNRTVFRYLLLAFLSINLNPNLLKIASRRARLFLLERDLHVLMPRRPLSFLSPPKEAHHVRQTFYWRALMEH